MIIPVKPLSVNDAWCGRRFKTPEYKQYEKDVHLALSVFIRKSALQPAHEKKPYAIRYKFFIKNWKATDTGNMEKPITDILVKSLVLPDDRYIMKMELEKSGPMPDGTEGMIMEWWYL